MASVAAWVVDTNVVVSAALTAGGNCDRILRAAVDGQIRLAWSTLMLAEYKGVLSRPKFGFSTPVVASLLSVFTASEQVTPVPVPRLPDPDDEVFLATALATTEKLLVTGNLAHFPEEICAPARILSPAAALRLLLHGK